MIMPRDITGDVSGNEAERLWIIDDLERYLDVLTSSTTTPIVQQVAAVLAFDRLDRLHTLDTFAEALPEDTQHTNKETFR